MRHPRSPLAVLGSLHGSELVVAGTNVSDARGDAFGPSLAIEADGDVTVWSHSYGVKLDTRSRLGPTPGTDGGKPLGINPQGLPPCHSMRLHQR